MALRPFLAGCKVHPAGSEALLAGYEALLVDSEALPAGLETYTAGSETNAFVTVSMGVYGAPSTPSPEGAGVGHKMVSVTK